MDADYSKAALINFVNTAGSQGLLNANTAAGWMAAISRILEDVAAEDDVRVIDVPTAIKRYHNKHPGDLKGTVLKEYERRLTRAVADFEKYTEDPTSYKGRGKGPTEANNKTPVARRLKTLKRDASKALSEARATLEQQVASMPAKVGMTVDFNMRPDFLAQVVVPKDMKANEAKRLCRLIMALAPDYDPEHHEGK